MYLNRDCVHICVTVWRGLWRLGACVALGSCAYVYTYLCSCAEAWSSVVVRAQHRTASTQVSVSVRVASVYRLWATGVGPPVSFRLPPSRYRPRVIVVPRSVARPTS